MWYVCQLCMDKQTFLQLHGRVLHTRSPERTWRECPAPGCQGAGVGVGRGQGHRVGGRTEDTTQGTEGASDEAMSLLSASRSVLGWGTSTPRGVRQCLETGLSISEMGCYWPLVGRGQDTAQRPHHAQDSPPRTAPRAGTQIPWWLLQGLHLSTRDPEHMSPVSLAGKRFLFVSVLFFPLRLFRCPVGFLKAAPLHATPRNHAGEGADPAAHAAGTQPHAGAGCREDPAGTVGASGTAPCARSRTASQNPRLSLSLATMVSHANPEQRFSCRGLVRPGRMLEAGSRLRWDFSTVSVHVAHWLQQDGGGGAGEMLLKSAPHFLWLLPENHTGRASCLRTAAGWSPQVGQTAEPGLWTSGGVRGEGAGGSGVGVCTAGGRPRPPSPQVPGVLPQAGQPAPTFLCREPRSRPRASSAPSAPRRLGAQQCGAH